MAGAALWSSPLTPLILHHISCTSIPVISAYTYTYTSHVRYTGRTLLWTHWLCCVDFNERFHQSPFLFLYQILLGLSIHIIKFKSCYKAVLQKSRSLIRMYMVEKAKRKTYKSTQDNNWLTVGIFELLKDMELPQTSRTNILTSSSIKTVTLLLCY